LSGAHPASGAYRAAGVDIDAQDRLLSRLKEMVRSTATPGVLSELGGFGGLFAVPPGLHEPVLVASADGVGTKLSVARMVGDFSTVGHDLVNHCVNDILVQGARPLFFLDYVGAGKLEAQQAAQLVAGVAAGCRENGCALLGGETAEMPGFYQPGDYELVGFIVGIVERRRLLGSHRVEVGDRLLGLRSAGLHTNGYSLARRVLFAELGLDPADPLPVPAEEGADERSPPVTVGAALLAPHLSYLEPISPLLEHRGLHALAHITGGGLTDNLPRSMPAGAHPRVSLAAWRWPPLFRLLAERGKIDRVEMLRVFNLGIGMVLVVAAADAEAIAAQLGDRGWDPVALGEVVAGDGGVEYLG
jgi:phosphoribosylformylglycinamidine cyclo-ligase